MYMAPTIEELVIELEQGIAAGSGASPQATPQATGWGAGDDDTINGDAS